MPNYKWRGINTGGTFCSGRTPASSATQLQTILFKKNIALLNCAQGSFLQNLSNLTVRTTRPSHAQLEIFFHYLAQLIVSGIPLERALELSHPYLSSERLRTTVLQLSHDVKTGRTLSNAFEKHPLIFTPLMIQLVKAGEHSGTLGAVLTQISRYLHLKNDMVKKLLNATFLPALILACALVVSIGILVFVVPQFKQFFSAMHKDLPFSTQLVLRLSSMITIKHCVMGIIVCTIVIFIGRQIFRTTAIQPSIDTLLLKSPIAGKMIQLFNLSLFVQTLCLLLKSGIPLAPALKATHPVISNSIIQNHTKQLSYHIEHGKTLEDAFTVIQSPYFPPTLIAAVSVGEQTGKLHAMLEKAQHFFYESLNTHITRTTTIFQPLLLIIVGLIIAGIMLAIYIPIFSLAEVGFS